MRSMCTPGLGVAPLDGHAEPVRDLALGVGQVGGALAHALLEQLVVAADAVAHRRSANWLQAIAPNAADDQREERRGDVEDLPASKASCAADEERPRRRRR